MTFPTPIGVLKSPRPMDESNLSTHIDSASVLVIHRRVDVFGQRWRSGAASELLDWGEVCKSLLCAPALVVLLLGIVKTAGVFDGHLVTLPRPVHTVARFDDLASNPHPARCGELRCKFL